MLEPALLAEIRAFSGEEKRQLLSFLLRELDVGDGDLLVPGRALRCLVALRCGGRGDGSPGASRIAKEGQRVMGGECFSVRRDHQCGAR